MKVYDNFDSCHTVIRYGSVCSGIEAATAAWHPLGWKPSFFSEIEAFPRAVLAHHYPTVPMHGDFTTIGADQYGPVDLLVGGTPCQSFSIAGLRGGLDDDRGNLALEFLKLADRLRARWLVWENVPGVLSANGGRDFGSILGGLVECGYGFAYRVLDAQYFGVAQRRRRVFVVGHLGDWRRAAAVLFERESLSGNSAPRRQTGKRLTGAIASSIASGADVVAFQSKASASQSMNPAEVAPTLDKSKADGTAIAYAFKVGQGAKAKGIGWQEEVAPTLIATDSGTQRSCGLLQHSVVRRLTPIECERLQGFPDNFTAIPWRGKPAENCPDGPRYKALGNSMAVPVMRWIGERIKKVDKIVL